MLKPSVIKNAKRATNRGVKGNFKGEGRLLGGLLVVGTGDSGVSFEHREAVSNGLGLTAWIFLASLGVCVSLSASQCAAACQRGVILSLGKSAIGTGA